MIKKLLLTVLALLAFTCSGAFGQAFTPIAPSDLGLVAGSGPINSAIFDISSLIGEAPNTITMRVDNGHVSTITDSWTVGEGNTTLFTLGGTGLAQAFVNHGANLGSDTFQNGSQSRDGITAAPGETWTLTSALDADYTAGQNANDYFIDYTGAGTGLQSNSVGFRWVSDDAPTSFSVFSNNTTDLNNNYTVGFRTLEAVPEPAAGMVLLFAGLFAARRRKRS